jgi:hypothetical protein
MTGLMGVDRVWRWQGRSAQAAVSCEWGALGVTAVDQGCV